MKFCGGCGLEKPLTEFHIRTQSKDGRQTQCKDCLNRHRRGKRKPNDPLTQRKAALMRRYGLTIDEYDVMVTEQNNCCAICGKDMGSGHGRHTDHNHEINLVRGLLCSGCNTSLGRIEQVGLLAFQNYLEER